MDNIFAINLKNLRKNKNITQDQLAKVLNVSRATIAGYESKGKQPDYNKLMEIARYFDVSIDFLIGYEPKNSSISEDAENYFPDFSNLKKDDAEIISLLIKRFRKNT